MSAEILQFKTELKQLLHLIVHSLYSHKDIFLRELISNASDAIDTIRFQSLTRAELLEDNADWKIKLIPDPDKGTLTVSDNGVGMSKETIVENLGTIARSGTRAFLESLKQAEAKDRPELIGQFGVGFYSAFMVADKVTVISRMAGPLAGPPPSSGGGSGWGGVQWESDGQGEFTITDVAKPTRGTDVILHLREDSREFLEAYRLRGLVKKYSDFVEHPIAIDVEKEEKGEKTKTEEILNARKAIWLRNKAQITPEEYHEFYKHLAHDHQDPLKTIHYTAEGTIEFRALLYIPAHKPYDLLWGDSKKGLHLYIQRVFIMDDCETLLPRYLRFMRGVVDSPDLPLNVSRELLQQSAPLEKIKSNLTIKVLNTLEDMKNKEYDNYVRFFQDLGVFLKEGIAQDWTNREKLANLMLFQSTRTTKSPLPPGERGRGEGSKGEGPDSDRFTTLARYVEGMAPDQQEIFYLTGESRELMEQSPHLEAFRAKVWEVLLLDDPMDEFVVDALHEFKGKHLKAVDRGGLDAKTIEEDQKKKFQPLLDYFKEKLPDIKEARLSTRLKESAVCLVTEEGGPSAHMERLLQRMHQDQPTPTSKRILEINADHPVIQSLEQLLTQDKNDQRLEAYARLLFDQAVLTEGSKIKDPLAFVQRINELVVKDLGG